MAIRDLLWRCPLCDTVEGIQRTPRGEVCSHCSARFRRGRGATIIANPKAGEPISREPHEWLATFKAGDVDGEGFTLPEGVNPPYRQPCIGRIARDFRQIKRRGEFLGWVELYGPRINGEFLLSDFRASLEADGRVEWSASLIDFRAVQPASASIQIYVCDGSIVSLKFPSGSVRLWEQRIKHAVRKVWRANGRGEIHDFQPHIATV